VAAAIEVLLLVRLLRHHFLEMVDFVLYTFTFHIQLSDFYPFLHHL
jgi:hypothetical protein